MHSNSRPSRSASGTHTLKCFLTTPSWNILDLTKDWLNVTYHEVGKLTLTQNPINVSRAEYASDNLQPGRETESMLD